MAHWEFTTQAAANTAAEILSDRYAVMAARAGFDIVDGEIVGRTKGRSRFDAARTVPTLTAYASASNWRVDFERARAVGLFRPTFPETRVKTLDQMRAALAAGARHIVVDAAVFDVTSTIVVPADTYIHAPDTEFRRQYKGTAATYLMLLGARCRVDLGMISCGADGAGKLIWAPQEDCYVAAEVGTWRANTDDGRNDGWCVTLLGDRAGADILGGDAETTNGTDLLHIAGGDDMRVAVCDGEGGDDVLGVFPVTPNDLAFGMRDISAVRAVVGGSSRAARLLAGGIAATAAHTSSTATVSDLLAAVTGTGCAESTATTGNGGVSLVNRIGGANTQVTGWTVVGDLNAGVAQYLTTFRRCSNMDVSGLVRIGSTSGTDFVDPDCANVVL